MAATNAERQRAHRARNRAKLGEGEWRQREARRKANARAIARERASAQSVTVDGFTRKGELVPMDAVTMALGILIPSARGPVLRRLEQILDGQVDQSDVRSDEDNRRSAVEDVARWRITLQKLGEARAREIALGHLGSDRIIDLLLLETEAPRRTQ